MSGMLSCRDATRLVSKSMDHKLPMSETIELKMHMFMCKLCSRFRKQVLSIRQVVRDNADLFEEGIAQDALNPEAKERMRRMLEKDG